MGRLGRALQRPGRAADDDRRTSGDDGLARPRRRPGGVIHGELGVPLDRTLPTEARRVHLRDGGPPGPVQLGPARLEWIREVHAKIIQDKRPVVIIHDQPDEIELPDKGDEAAFNDVYIVKGDPTSEVVLRRAKVPKAHSVVVLTDDREGKHADGKSILTCIAVRNICRGEKQPNISTECRNPSNRHHLKKAGADEIISSDELGLRLLARAALFHGMTRVYQELLTVGRDANEMFLLPAPEGLVGKDFIELTGMFARHRDDKKSCLLIGIQRGDEMHLNPIGGEAGPLKTDDQLILLSRVLHDPSQPVPTVPPIMPPPAKT